MEALLAGHLPVGHPGGNGTTYRNGRGESYTSYSPTALGNELVGQAGLLLAIGAIRVESEVALGAAEASTSLVQANRTAGNLFRDELAEALRAEGRTVYTEAYKKTPFGKRFIDLDVWDNGVNLGGIETKVGSSRYHSLQKLKDAWLEANGYPVQLVRKP